MNERSAAETGAALEPVRTLRWPDGARFAFTVFDDTDNQTASDVRPVYDFLHELGMRTTKSVWPLPGRYRAANDGVTCADPSYVAWTLDLQSEGFEIAMHNATYHTSRRETTVAALERFRLLYGHDPLTLANHFRNREGIYWGDARLSPPQRGLYNLLTRGRGAGTFQGHLEGSPLFWGDLCRARVGYVRNFVFDEIDTLRACPQMPYFDPERPFVRAWFASTEGADVDLFVRTLSEANQDRLAAQGGACIMYTHFANGFVRKGRLDARFERRMRRLADMGGWFVPVGTLLRHIEAKRGLHVLGARERNRLERRWLARSVRARLAPAA